MSDHTGMVVIGEPVLATRVLFQRTLGALFTVLAATSVSAILELLCDGPVGP